jgi:hypothetical protein
VSIRLRIEVLEQLLAERGLLWQDLGLPSSTVARLRAGKPIRPRTVARVIAKIRETPVVPELRGLIDTKPPAGTARMPDTELDDDARETVREILARPHHPSAAQDNLGHQRRALREARQA